MNDENYDLEKIYKELEILDDETKEETEEYNEMKQRTLNSEIQNHEFKVISINQEIETETAIKAYPALSILKLNNQEIETETAIKAYPALSILKLNNQENETETAIDADPDPIELKTLLGAKENETETAIDADPDPIELKTLLGSILKLNNQENETETAIDADPDPIELKTLLGAKENETETVIDADPDPIELKTLLGSILCDSNNKAQIEKHQMILKVLYDEIALLKALYDQIAGAAHIEAHDETVSRDSNNEAQIEKHQIILKTLYDQITVLKALYDQIAGVARTEAHDDTISRDSNNEPQIRMHQTILKVLYDKIAVLKALYDQIAGVAHTNNEAQIGMNHMILRLHPWHLTQLLEIVHSTVSVSCIQSLRCRKLGCLLDTDICIESLLGSLHIATTLALLHVQNKCHAFREFKILGVVTWISWHINGVILQNQSNNSSGIVLELKSEVSSHGIGTIFVGLTGAFLNINNGINMQVIDTSLIIVAWHYVTTVNLAYFTSNIKHASVYNEEHQRFFNKVMHSLISPNGNVTIKLIDSTACILLKELSINPIFNTKLYNGSYPLQNGHRYKVLCSLSLKQNGNDCINKKAVSLAIKEWNKDNEIFHISYYNIAMCLYHRTHFNKLLITTLITCNELIQSIAFNKTMNEQIIKLNKKTKIMDHHKICGGSKEILVQILEMDTLSYYRAIYLLDCHSIWNTLNMILQKAQYLLLSSNKIKKVKSNDCYIDDFGTNKDDTMSLYLCLSRILYPQIYDEFYIYNDNEDPDQDTENDAKYGLSYYIDENEAKCGQKPPDPTLDPPEENEGQGIKDLDSAINVLEIAKIEQEKILTNAAETDKECTVEEATNDNIADAFKVFSIDQEIETETEEQYVNVDPNEYRGLLITCLYPQIYDEYYIYNGNGGVLCCDIKAMIRQYIDNNNLWDNDFHCNRLVDLYHVDIVLNVIKESIQKDPTRDIAQNGYNDQPLSSNKISSITRTNNRQCNDINKAYIARCNESHVLYHNLCDEHSYHICCNLNTMIVNIPSTSMFSTNDTLLYNGELYYVAEHHLMYFGGKQSIFDDYDDISSDIWYYDLNERLSVYKHPKEISCYVFGKDKIQQTFDIFDRTKTGYVSISDIKDTIYHLEFGVNVSDNSLDYMFRLCDTMDDGQTSLQEFQKWFKRDINGTKAPTHDDAKLFDVIYDLEIIIRYLLMPKATQYHGKEATKAFDAKFHSVDAVTILKEYENGQTLCGCDINSDHNVLSFQYVKDMIYHSDDLRLDSNRAKDDLKLMRDRSRSLSVSNIEVSTIFDEPLNETLSTMSTISIESLQIHEYKDIVDDVLSEDDISDFQPRFTSYLRKWEGIQCIKQHVDDADGRLPSTDVPSTVISNQSFDPPSNSIKIIQLIHIDNGCLFIIDFMVNSDIMVICNEINEELYEFQSVAAKKVALINICESSGIDYFKNDNCILNKCSEWGRILILEALSQYEAKAKQVKDICECVITQSAHSNSAAIRSFIWYFVMNYDYYVNTLSIYNLVENKEYRECIFALNDCSTYIWNKTCYNVQQSVIVIKNIFRRYPWRYETIIVMLCDHLQDLNDYSSKTSMIWIIGEYAERYG